MFELKIKTRAQHSVILIPEKKMNGAKPEK